MAKIQGFSLSTDISNEALAKAISAIQAGLWMNSSTVRRNLGTGTPDSSTFLRGDGVWASPPQAWPVGSIFISVVSTNPNTLLGYGTWVAFATGRTLVGIDSGDTDFDAAEETRGAKTVASAGSVAAPTISGSTAAEASHTHSVTAAGTNSAPTFTGNAVNSDSVSAGTPAGTNSVPTFTGTPGTTGQASAGATNTGPTASAVTIRTHTHSFTPAGTVSAPTFTGNALAGHTHSTTATGSVSAPTFTGSSVTSGAGSSHLHAAGTLAASAPAFTGSPTSVVQPSIVVYMWKRTA